MPVAIPASKVKRKADQKLAGMPYLSRKTFLKSIVFFALVFFNLTSFSLANSKVVVFTSILPQSYFLEKLGGDFWEVQTMLPEGADPHTYEPKPADLRKLSKAQVYFSWNLPFEQVWLKRFQGLNPDLKIVNCAQGIKYLQFQKTSEFLLAEQEPREEGHFLDPHIWLSPANCLQVVKNIYEFCLTNWPEQKERFQANYLALEKEIKEVDAQIRKLLAPCKKKVFLVFHPSWGYFANTYGFKQVSVEVEGREPTPRELMHMLDTINQFKLKSIFIQPQFNPREVQFLVQKAKLQLEVVDPLAKDWKANLLKMAQKIRGQCAEDSN
ncbi:MAG: zinc transport system substrate-binding protein [Desulfonauticus sp.]|jgi:zinc transport system substrate-binding protein|nr:zinc transport system substrate-binding protein [Desulfonauticus sp.]